MSHHLSLSPFKKPLAKFYLSILYVPTNFFSLNPFVDRKVAAVSGDARRALALCTRSLELAGPDGAGLKEVQQALGEAASSAAVRAIRSCSAAEQLMLKAVAAEVSFFYFYMT